MAKKERKEQAKITARLPADLWFKLRTQALREGRPAQELLTDACMLYLKTTSTGGSR
jgi:hypothetical protein